MYVNRIKATLAILGMSAIGSVTADARAVGSVQSTVTQININMSGTVFVRFSSTITGRPPCATNTNEFAFDGNTTAGRAVLSLLQAAQLSGKQVNATGMNHCAVNATRETLNQATILAN